VNDFEGVLDDSHRQELFTVVSALDHHSVDKSLDNRALRLSESDLVESSGTVGQEFGLGALEVDVIGQSHVVAFDLAGVPSTEKKNWGGFLFKLALAKLFLDKVLFDLLDGRLFSPILVSHCGYFFGLFVGEKKESICKFDLRL